MFNWQLFLLLSLLSLPGILIVIPRLVGSLLSKRQPTRPSAVIKLAAVLQTLVLLLIFCAVGTAVTPGIGLKAPFFEALAAGSIDLDALLSQIIPSLIVGIGGAVVFVAAYYMIFRPRLDQHTLAVTESLRAELGLAGRVFYGGIFEEVLTRWGLLSVVIWAIAKVSGVLSPVTIWVSIVIAGVLFGLGHLPSAVGAGARISPALVSTAIALNLWAAILFGWLFWQYGLVAAMLGHILFHLIWYPFERRHVWKNSGSSPVSLEPE